MVRIERPYVAAADDDLLLLRLLAEMLGLSLGLSRGFILVRVSG